MSAPEVQRCIDSPPLGKPRGPLRTAAEPEWTDLHRQIAATLLPGFAGTTLPEWLAKRLRDGLAGVCVFGGNIVSRRQLRTLTDLIRAANPNALITIDEEGSDVTRLYYDRGSPYPGNAVLGRIDDVEHTESVAAIVGWELRLAAISLSSRMSTAIRTLTIRLLACAASVRRQSSSPGTARPGSAAFNPPASRSAPSTSPATATPHRTRTSRYRSSTFRSIGCARELPSGGELMIVGEDNDWVRELIDDARVRHPSTVIVDMGWPSDNRAYADIATFGASRYVGRALLAWLDAAEKTDAAA